jgi:CelD/BcsL family acetyltransferase involved in cellulose biosynthesis
VRSEFVANGRRISAPSGAVTHDVGRQVNPAAAGMRLVSSPAEFTALRDAWNMAAASSLGAAAFFSHEWFDAAWQWRQHTARLHVLCFFSGQRLAAILPLVISEARVSGLPVRELAFLAVPDTQMCDMIVAEQDRASATAAFASELARRRGEWDVMRLHYLRPGSIAASALRAALESRGFVTRMATVPGNPFVALDSSWEAYYATRSRRLKKSNNLASNRLHKAGEIRIDWLAPDAAEKSGFGNFVERAIAISGRSWKIRTGNSLDNPGPQAFIRRLSESAERRAWLSIWILSLNERPLAMEYQLIADHTVYALRSDFDAEFDAVSPGTHLSGYLLKQLFGRGLRRYYMGPGNNAYKFRWTDDVEPVEELTVYGRSLAARGMAAWETTLKPVARRLRDRVRVRASSPER